VDSWTVPALDCSSSAPTLVLYFSEPFAWQNTALSWPNWTGAVTNSIQPRVTFAMSKDKLGQCHQGLPYPLPLMGFVQNLWTVPAAACTTQDVVGYRQPRKEIINACLGSEVARTPQINTSLQRWPSVS
jgi:hypothetical protein